MKIEPGRYMWRSKDVDLPVTVIECVGKGPDGRFYVRIADSNTAIPADELKKVHDVLSSRRPKPRPLF
jgi:hypothetical protein